MAKLQEITDSAFQAEVLESDRPVVVDFWAPWCGPCRTVGKVLEGIAAQRSDVKIVSINIDDNQEQAIAHGVMLLPTVVLYKNGEIVGKLQGGVPPKQITGLIESHLGEAE